MKLHTLIQQGDVEEEGIAGKGRGNAHLLVKAKMKKKE